MHSSFVVCPTTGSPSSASPNTFTPSTSAPITTTPVTVVPSASPSTSPSATPSTSSPLTLHPVSSHPLTANPTIAPSSLSPSTNGPVTCVPITKAPSSLTPSTSSPGTHAPTTSAPSSLSPSTRNPTTDAPTTLAPVTEAPTRSPLTAVPSSSPTTTCPSQGVVPSFDPEVSAPVIPWASTATFDSALTIVNVIFTAATNEPECTSLLTTELIRKLGKEYKCLWVRSTQLDLITGTNPTILPEEILHIRAGVLGDPTFRAVATAHHVSVSAPKNPLPVSLSLTGPTLIGRCDPVMLRTTVTGAGGRAVTHSWTYEGDNSAQDTAAMNAVLKRGSTSSVMSFVSGNFTDGTHTFRLNVSNFIGVSGNAVLIFVKNSEVEPPKVALSAGSLIEASTDSQVVLRSQTEPPLECAGFVGSTRFYVTRAVWTPITSQTVNVNGETIKLAAHRAATVSKVWSGNSMLLNSGDLSPNELPYGFQLHVTTLDFRSTIPRLVGETKLTQLVKMYPGTISTQLSGGASRQIPVTSSVSRSFIITASPKYDPADASHALAFAWTLTDAVSGVPVVIPTSDILGNQLTLSTDLLVANKVYSLTVTATGVKGLNNTARTATDQQFIYTLARDIPIVDATVENGVVGSSGALKFNREDKLKLKMSATVSGSAPITYSWSCETGGFDLGNRDNRRTGLNETRLVIAAGVLQAGVVYQFRASATAYGITGASIVQVQMNFPPASGSCQASPSVGQALLTEFLLSCTGWEDEDMPLKYKYQSEQAGSFVDLCDSRYLESYSTMLPAGETGNLTIRALVVDNLGATVQNFMQVRLEVRKVVVEDSIGEIEKRARQGDTESVTVLISGTTALLNANASLLTSNTSSHSTDSGEGEGGGNSGDSSNGAVNALVQKTRTSLLSTINTLVLAGGESDDKFTAVEAPASLIEAVTTVSHPDELTSESRILAVEMIASMTSSPLNSFSESTVKSTVGAIANVIKSSQESSSSSEAEKQSLGQTLEPTLALLGSGMLKSASEGEDPVELVVEGINIVSQVVSADEVQGKSYSTSFGSEVVMPQSLDLGLTSSVEVSITTLKQQIYPSYSHVSDSLYEAQTMVVNLAVGGVTIENNTASSGSAYVLKIPLNTSGMTSTTLDSLQCRFWDPQIYNWSTNGITSSSAEIGGEEGDFLVCESSHLTCFSSAIEFKIAVNTINEEDILLDAFSFKNPVFTWCIVIIGLWGLVLLIGGQYDRCNAQKLSQEEFWRKNNGIFHLRFRPRSVHSFYKRTSWAMRHKHPWAAVLMHHGGDFMNTVKRSTILTVLIFNTMTVVMLLRGQRQQLPFLTSDFATTLVAIMFSLPVPMIVFRIYLRPIPKKLQIESNRIEQTNTGCMGQVLNIFMALLLEEVAIQEDEGDDNDEEKKKDRQTQAAVAASSLFSGASAMKGTKSSTARISTLLKSQLKLDVDVDTSLPPWLREIKAKEEHKLQDSQQNLTSSACHLMAISSESGGAPASGQRDLQASTLNIDVNVNCNGSNGHRERNDTCASVESTRSERRRGAVLRSSRVASDVSSVIQISKCINPEALVNAKAFKKKGDEEEFKEMKETKQSKRRGYRSSMVSTASDAPRPMGFYRNSIDPHVPMIEETADNGK
eukprot:jgi/Bigna1/136060/aug1.32_g10768